MKSIFRIIGYTEGLRGYLLGITIASVLVAAIGVATPFVIAHATDLMVQALGGRSVGLATVVWIAVLLLMFDLLSTLIRNIGGYWGDMMAAKLREQLSTVYYRHLLQLPQSYFDNELTGTIINRLNRAITDLSNFLNMFANNFFQLLLTGLITIVIVYIYSWQLAVLVVISYPIFLWLTALTSRKWQIMQAEKNTETDIASGRFAEAITQMKVVKSFIYEKLELKHFTRHFQNTIDITRRQSIYWHKMDITRGSVLSIIFFGIFAYIFAQTIEQRFTIGTMVLLITLINGLKMPLFNLSMIVDNFQKAVAGSIDVLRALQIDPEIRDSPGALKLAGIRGEIVFEKVSFAYDDQQRSVLRQVDFDIKSGEHIAFVGASGGGKTTITSLLMRLYEPLQGRILVDGVDISKIQQASLRHNIAMVFQDPSLFSGSIRENIAYSRPRATNAEVVAAAKAANAEEFIDKLKDGYNTQIGERGLKLSGGQKQRIAIARAILKDTPILILDEATSALDSRSEQLVQQALARLMKNRTTLIIAHRLSTIASVDRIITLRNGQVDEVGTPEHLATTGGLYATLLGLQQAATAHSRDRLARFGISTNH